MYYVCLYTYVAGLNGARKRVVHALLLQLLIMPSYFAWKLLQILLISRSSFALDSNSYLAPLNSLDGGPPVSFATAENGVTGNFVADSNIGLTGEPINDPQPSDLFNSPNTLVQLSEGDSNACLRGTDISPNRRRRGKRERQSCDSNLFLAPGAGKKPTAPAGLHDHESGQQQKPSSSHQDQKKEPSADTKADPNNESPCNDEEYIHALCGPVSASWQIGSMNARTLRFMLGAANTCMLLDSSHFPLISSPAKTERFYSNRSSIRTVAYRCAGVPPGCVQPDVAWCCKIVAPVSLILFPTHNTGNPTTSVR